MAESVSLVAARAYADYGWSVFPTRPGAKTPLTRRGFKQATRDPKQIEEWWTRQPDAGVAVRTGPVSDLLVIDVDPRNHGDQSLAGLQKQLGDLPPTVEAITGGGGRHFLYHCPNGFNCARGLEEGVDIKGEGGYIVVCPSIHPSGQRYRWAKNHTPGDLEVASLPETWLSRIHSLKQPAPPRESRNSPEEGDSGKRIIPKGRRHDMLLSLAGAMRRHGAEPDEIAAALHVTNRNRCRPVEPDFVIEQIARSLGRYAPQGRVRQIQMEDPGARARRAPDDVDWVFDDWLGMGDAALLVGEPEIGKSWLFMELAVCCALGLPVLGHWAIPRTKVLMIDEENPREELHRRLYNVVRAHEGNPDELKVWLAMTESCQGFSFRDRARIRALHELVEEQRPDLILLDSLTAISDIKKEIDPGEIRRFFTDHIYPLRAICGSAVLLAHHPNKQVYSKKDRPEDIGLVRGSIDMVASVDSLLFLQKAPVQDTDESLNPRLILKSLKVRRGPKPKPLFLRLVQGVAGGLRPLVLDGPSLPAWDPASGGIMQRAACILLEILAEATEGSLDSSTLLQEARKRFPALQGGSTAKVALFRLRKQGQVLSERVAKQVLYRLPDPQIL